MKKLILLLLFSTFLISCQPEGRVYIKHKDLSPDVEWLKADIREFKVPIDDLQKVYNMSISFRYAEGFPFQYVKIRLTETTPSGAIIISEHDLKVREDNGEYIGEPGYDIWDSEHFIEMNKKYNEAGEYTYTIEHIMQQDPLNFAMEIGIILDEAK